MAVGVQMATVGMAVAVAGGLIAAVSTGVRLLWDLQDRRAERAARAATEERRRRLEESTPKVQTFTEAQMREAVRGPAPPSGPPERYPGIGAGGDRSGRPRRPKGRPRRLDRRAAASRLAVAGALMVVFGLGLVAFVD